MVIGREVTVLGAGVAGLAVARALALRGARVTVLEQAPEIREVGAGLQISPNGARVLEALGLGDALDAAGTRAASVELRDGETGDMVLSLDLARHRPERAFRFVHRADLIALLAEGARAAGVQIRLLQQVDEVRLGDHPPRLVTRHGAEIECDLLIGADGLHSRVRAALNGAVAPFFTGQVAWRAVLPADPATIPPVAQVHMGPGRHLVTYPLRGGTLRNIVAVEERRRWVEESWSLTDDPMALRLAFQDFAPDVRGWLDQVEAPGLWGLFRHPVASRWHGQGAAILGDAAHPTLPFLAQGAVMALEDAWVLADSLSLSGLDEGPALYQARRRSRVVRVIEEANRNARNYHHANPLARAIGFGALRALNGLRPEALLNRYDWIYDRDVTRE